MKRAITLIAGTGLALGATYGLAAPKQARSYLYALSGKNAQIKHMSNNEYTLEMTLPANKQVTMFSDRPYRIVKPISGLALKKIWQQGGNNSFAANPPNAVLEVAGADSMVVTLTGFQIDKNRTTYTFHPIANIAIPQNWAKAHNLSVNMTID